MKRRLLWVFMLCTTIVVLLFVNVRFSEIYSLPDGFLATREEVEYSNQNGLFGNFISASMEQTSQSVSTDRTTEGYITFKLFGFIPIRKVVVVCAEEEEVFVGGVPIGISISAKGAIVINEKMVETEDGLVETEKSEKFKEGDIIIKINNKDIKSLDELSEYVEQSDEEWFDITFLRKNAIHTAKIQE